MMNLEIILSLDFDSAVLSNGIGDFLKGKSIIVILVLYLP